jgi:hypothetical protein
MPIRPSILPRTTLHPTMSSAFLLPGLRRGALLATPLILSTPFLVHSYRNPILCDSPAGFLQGGSSPLSTYTRDAKVPIVKQSGAPNPRAVRQISLGSILGVMGGLGVSVFSKPLALLIGLGVIIVQVSQFFLTSDGLCYFCACYILQSEEGCSSQEMIAPRIPRHPPNTVLLPPEPGQEHECKELAAG